MISRREFLRTVAAGTAGILTVGWTRPAEGIARPGSFVESGVYRPGEWAENIAVADLPDNIYWSVERVKDTLKTVMGYGRYIGPISDFPKEHQVQKGDVMAIGHRLMLYHPAIDTESWDIVLWHWLSRDEAWYVEGLAWRPFDDGTLEWEA